MELDLGQLQNLLTTLNQTDISEFTLKVEDLELVVRRHHPGGVVVAQAVPQGITETIVPVDIPLAPLPTPATPPPSTKPSGAAMPPGKKDNSVEILSPMVGTFYRAPAPGEPSFVSVGDTIRDGQTVCIIEAMKLMNELEAEVSGQVVEILVENGQPVEFNQPLMRVIPSA